MTREIMSLKDLVARLLIPDQDLSRLSFCPNTKASSVFDWIHGLPLTQAEQVSAIFYTALPELSRVKANWELRLSIAETVRTPLHHCMEGLSKRYLNQPLIMPEAAVKMATVGQALQKHLLNTYLVIIRDICINTKDKEHHLALAIYRALTCVNYLLLRSYQLYLPPPEYLWQTAHALFLIAEELDILEEPCVDPLLTQSHQNPLQAYVRILLIAASRPNQLRQEEIQQLFSLLEKESYLIKLQPLASIESDNSLITLPQSDLPPMFISKAKQSNLKLTHAFELDVSALLNHLKELSQANTTEEVKEQKITPPVIQHLQTSWQQQTQRSFSRQVTRLNIDVIVGLTNIHFYLSGELPFQVFLQQENAVAGKANEFVKRGIQLKQNMEADPWEDAFEMTGDSALKSTTSVEQRIRQQAIDQYQGHHQTFSVPLIDKSAGGYGLEWQGEIPIQVKTGELLALKEANRPHWVLGVIRWAHQIKGATQLGIQILSPKATPVGIALIHRSGGYTEYLRGLQIPELRAINQPTSLITNAVTFHENSKVKLFMPEQGNQTGPTNIQLTKRIFSTGAFNQFGYRTIVASTKEDE